MAQQQLVEIADRPVAGVTAPPTAPTLEPFLAGLRTAWHAGEVRPTSRAKERPSEDAGVPIRSQR